MCSGKTTVGRALAKKLSLNYVDTDELIVEKSKMSIPEIFEKLGEEYFRDLEYETAKNVISLSPTVVSTGGGMLTFERNAKALKDAGIIICLCRDFEKIYEEIKSDVNRPLAYNKSKEEIKSMYELRVGKYQKYARYTVENNGSVDDCVQKIISIID